jgi:hypothetical protein
MERLFHLFCHLLRVGQTKSEKVWGSTRNAARFCYRLYGPDAVVYGALITYGGLQTYNEEE